MFRTTILPQEVIRVIAQYYLTMIKNKQMITNPNNIMKIELMGSVNYDFKDWHIEDNPYRWKWTRIYNNFNKKNITYKPAINNKFITIEPKNNRKFIRDTSNNNCAMCCKGFDNRHLFKHKCENEDCLYNKYSLCSECINYEGHENAEYCNNDDEEVSYYSCGRISCQRKLDEERPLITDGDMCEECDYIKDWSDLSGIDTAGCSGLMCNDCFDEGRRNWEKCAHCYNYCFKVHINNDDCKGMELSKGWVCCSCVEYIQIGYEPHFEESDIDYEQFKEYWNSQVKECIRCSELCNLYQSTHMRKKKDSDDDDDDEPYEYLHKICYKYLNNHTKENMDGWEEYDELFRL